MKLKHYYVAGILAAACLEFALVQVHRAMTSLLPGNDNNDDDDNNNNLPRGNGALRRKGPVKRGPRAAARNNNNDNKQNERRIPVQHLKVPTPVIILSLPKSGTSSLYQYFNCGGLKAAHTFARDPETHKEYRLGTRMRKNFRQNLPLLTNTGKLQVYTDIGEIQGQDNCFYPSIHALESIARDYPNATIINSYRPNWYASISKFQLLGKRWKKWCPIFPNTTEPADWEMFYRQHRQRIRTLAQQYPSLHHLEFDLSDPTAGQQLEDFTGISQSCWGDCKPTMKCNYHDDDKSVGDKSKES